MNNPLDTLLYCSFRSIVVLFVLPRELDRQQFEACLQIVSAKSTREVGPQELETYWSALQVRIRGDSRWDRVSPPVVPNSSDDWLRRRHLSENTVDNIPLKRPYIQFRSSGLKYVLDVWNPRNELGVDYPGAGEPVLALVLGEETVGDIQDRLADNHDFYDILRSIARVCDARNLVGMNAANLFCLVRAYFLNAIDAKTDPWSFLFPLQVMRLQKNVGNVALGRYFKKVQDWGDGRLLLQVKSGIDYTINRQNADAAKLLGMRAVQELNPDLLREKNTNA